MIGNPDPGLGQAQKCGRVKVLNRILTMPLFDQLESHYLNTQIIFEISVQIAYITLQSIKQYSANGSQIGYWIRMI
jgi:hypothetical protein